MYASKYPLCKHSIYYAVCTLFKSGGNFSIDVHNKVYMGFTFVNEQTYSTLYVDDDKVYT